MLLVQGGVESRNMRGDGSPRRADKERVHTENEGAQIGFGDCHNVPSNVTVAAVGIQTQTHRHRSTGTRMLVLYIRMFQQFKNSLQVCRQVLVLLVFFLFWRPVATWGTHLPAMTALFHSSNLVLHIHDGFVCDVKHTGKSKFGKLFWT